MCWGGRKHLNVLEEYSKDGDDELATHAGLRTGHTHREIIQIII